MKLSLSGRPTRSTLLTRQPAVTDPEAFDLFRRWRDQDDRRAADRLIRAHLPIVWALARSFRGYGLPNEDLVSAGYEGLVRALHKFELRGVPFRAYARHWIRAQMFEAVLRARSVTASKSNRASRYFFITRSELVRLRAVHGGDEEAVLRGLARSLGVSEEEAASIVALVERFDESLDAPLGASAGETRLAALANPEGLEDAEAHAARQQLRRLLHRALLSARHRFDAREWATLMRRQLADEPETLEAIARDFGVTRERIRQIEVAVLRRLRRIVPRELAG